MANILEVSDRIGKFIHRCSSKLDRSFLDFKTSKTANLRLQIHQIRICNGYILGHGGELDEMLVNWMKLFQKTSDSSSFLLKIENYQLSERALTGSPATACQHLDEVESSHE